MLLQLVQKVIGRPGAAAHAPVPLQQQQPLGQAYHGHAQAAGMPGSAAQHGQQQVWSTPDAAQPVQQGCGGFLRSLPGAVFGR